MRRGNAACPTCQNIAKCCDMPYGRGDWSFPKELISCRALNRVVGWQNAKRKKKKYLALSEMTRNLPRTQENDECYGARGEGECVTKVTEDWNNLNGQDKGNQRLNESWRLPPHSIWSMISNPMKEYLPLLVESVYSVRTECLVESCCDTSFQAREAGVSLKFFGIYF